MGFMGGGDGMRRLMDKDVVKPKSVSATLARFWPYFRQRWYALVIVAILMIDNMDSNRVAEAARSSSRLLYHY